jgi:hypothetical protein
LNEKKKILESSSEDNELIEHLDTIRKEEYLRMKRLKESMKRRENSITN